MKKYTGKGINIGIFDAGVADPPNTYGTISRWLDHIAYKHYVSFVASAGNSGKNGITSGKMAYNILTVGSVNDHSTYELTDDDVEGFSSYYNGDSLCYKPDIGAPGRFGTSEAAPRAAGILALLCEAQPNLLVNPEAQKAVLTATTNKDSHLRFTPADRTDARTSYMHLGAGLIDAFAAAECAINNNYANGTFAPATLNQSHTFTVSEAGSRVRISMAFLRPVGITNDNDHTQGEGWTLENIDLDLEVYQPGSSTPIATSKTSRNSVEIVEFTAPTVGTYTIRVVRTYAASNPTWYGVAWMIWK